MHDSYFIVYEDGEHAHLSKKNIDNNEPNFTLEQLIQVDASNLKNKSKTGISDTSTQTAHLGSTFDDSFQEYSDMYQCAGLIQPSFFEFEEAGINFTRCRSVYNQALEENLKPILVISPRLPLFARDNEKDNQQTWEFVFHKLTALGKSQKWHLQDRDDGHGLFMAATLKNKTIIDQLFYSEITSLKDSDHNYFINNSNVLWTVSLVLQSNDLGNYPFISHIDKHISASEYLAMQARQFWAKGVPQDGNSWVWLGACFDINNHHYALSSTWVPEYGQFRIYPNQTTYVHERLVTRVPIRP